MKTRLLFAALAATLLVMPAAIAAAQDDRARVMGVVTDASGGALPGATITLTGGPQPVAAVVSDESGRYMTPWVAPGTYTVVFTLSGFDTRQVTGVKIGRGQTIVLDQQMALAPLSETVEVRAPAPIPPPPPPMPRIPPTPRPKAEPVDKEILASVCGPRTPPEYSISIGKVLSERDSNRELLGPNDLLRVDAGTKEGVGKGMNFVVRRRYTGDDQFGTRKAPVLGEQTAGLIQIVEADETTSVAIVVYACSEIMAGDSVERYVAQPAFFAVSAGKPRFNEPAHITFGDSGREAASAGEMMVIDQGTMQGVTRGQRLTIFRMAASGRNNRITIGDGVIIAVRADSATIRIEKTTDAVVVGDLVALHR